MQAEAAGGPARGVCEEGGGADEDVWLLFFLYFVLVDDDARVLFVVVNE